LGAFDDLVLRREAPIDAVRDAIRCHGLTKRFRGTAAVDGLDLQVAEGEVFGFLGPNGAGKTTTIRLLLGLLRADAGQAWLLGERVPCPARLAQVGAMVEEPAFYPWMSGRRNLRILAKTGAPVAKHAVEEALARAGLSAVAGRKVKAYSQGMRQRLGLAVALLRKPRLLLLDATGSRSLTKATWSPSAPPPSSAAARSGCASPCGPTTRRPPSPCSPAPA
jgi:ABC-type multidrug transport system ATPase subunit